MKSFVLSSVLFVLLFVNVGRTQSVTQTIDIERLLGDAPTRLTFEPFDTMHGRRELIGIEIGFTGVLEIEVLIQNFSELELDANDWYVDAGANVILAFDQKAGYENGGPFYGLGGIFTQGITGRLSAGSGGPPFANPTAGEVDLTFSFSGEIDSQVTSNVNLDYFVSNEPIVGQTEPFQDFILTPPFDDPTAFINVSALQLFQQGTISMTYEFIPTFGRPEDCNLDGQLTADDLMCACDEPNADLDSILNALGLIKGDLDANGAVEFKDFLRLAGAFGTQADYTSGDINCDGAVDFDDFLKLVENFGKMSFEAPASVPEPAAGTLILICAVALLPNTRRPVLNR